MQHWSCGMKLGSKLRYESSLSADSSFRQHWCWGMRLGSMLGNESSLSADSWNYAALKLWNEVGQQAEIWELTECWLLNYAAMKLRNEVGQQAGKWELTECWCVNQASVRSYEWVGFLLNEYGHLAELKSVIWNLFWFFLTLFFMSARSRWLENDVAIVKIYRIFVYDL